jgi:hypothetical protein
LDLHRNQANKKLQQQTFWYFWFSTMKQLYSVCLLALFAVCSPFHTNDIHFIFKRISWAW